MPKPVPADKRLRAPKGLLEGPLAADPDPMEDGIPTPDPGALEPDEPAGWVPLSPDLPYAGLRAFQGLLEGIRYKPGYRLDVENHGHGLAGATYFTIYAYLANTYRPSEPPSQITMRFPLGRHVLERWGGLVDANPERARTEMLRFVRKCLGWHELHERDEWLKVGKDRPFDPHAGGRNQPYVAG
jgi:hypothetical protein